MSSNNLFGFEELELKKEITENENFKLIDESEIKFPVLVSWKNGEYAIYTKKGLIINLIYNETGIGVILNLKFMNDKKHQFLGDIYNREYIESLRYIISSNKIITVEQADERFKEIIAKINEELSNL